ncbi:FimV/HubP family polar landmark protein, partial [Vibrio amylolyticus]
MWRIASRVKPAPNLTVQQTLLAIYNLNPRAFENQNIHSLIPGSNLRIPSLAQVSSVSTQEAVNVMTAHQAKLDGVAATPAPASPSSSVSVQPQTELPKGQPKTTESKDSMVEMEDVKPSKATSTNKPPRVELLENELELSESELMALEEKNHKLRLMLSQVQTEVDGLKDELGDENRIRSEVEKLLKEERDRLADQKMEKPSILDQILSNNLLVAAMAIIPGLLVGLIIILLIGRRSKKDEPDEQMATQQEAPQAPVIPPQTLDESIDDDLLLDDDLFGDDVDIALDDDLDIDDTASAEDDVFAGLDDDDLDFNLEGEDDEDPFAGVGDNGDLEAELEDIDMSSNGISVNSEDKALGLEEMERALDDVSMDGNDEEAEFDLSDDGEMSQDDIEALLSGEDPTEDLLDDELDQSLLDELLSEAVDDDDDEIDSLLEESADDFNLDTEEPSGTSDSEIDDIFASVESENDLDLGDAPLASDSEIDDLFAQIESQADLETLEQQSVDDTALLDELLEESFDVDEDSTELLDELIDSNNVEPNESDLEEVEELDDNSTDLLDELLSESVTEEESNTDIPDESTQTLDEVLNGEAEADKVTIEEDSTDLLDELIDSVEEDNDLADSTETLDELVDSNDEFESDGTELFDELLEIEQQSTEQSLEADSADATPSEVEPENSEALSVGDENSDGLVSDDGLSESGDALADVSNDIGAEEAVDESNPLESAAELEEPEAFSSEEFIDDMLSAAPDIDPLLETMEISDNFDNEPITDSESVEDNIGDVTSLEVDVDELQTQPA